MNDKAIERDAMDDAILEELGIEGGELAVSTENVILNWQTQIEKEGIKRGLPREEARAIAEPIIRMLHPREDVQGDAMHFAIKKALYLRMLDRDRKRMSPEHEIRDDAEIIRLATSNAKVSEQNPVKVEKDNSRTIEQLAEEHGLEDDVVRLASEAGLTTERKLMDYLAKHGSFKGISGIGKTKDAQLQSVVGTGQQ